MLKWLVRKTLMIAESLATDFITVWWQIEIVWSKLAVFLIYSLFLVKSNQAFHNTIIYGKFHKQKNPLMEYVFLGRKTIGINCLSDSGHTINLTNYGKENMGKLLMINILSTGTITSIYLHKNTVSSCSQNVIEPSLLLGNMLRTKLQFFNIVKTPLTASLIFNI